MMNQCYAMKIQRTGDPLCAEAGTSYWTALSPNITSGAEISLGNNTGTAEPTELTAVSQSFQQTAKKVLHAEGG